MTSSRASLNSAQVPLTVAVAAGVLSSWPSDGGTLHPACLDAVIMAYSFRHAPELSRCQALRVLLNELHTRANPPSGQSLGAWGAALIGCIETHLKAYYHDWTHLEAYYTANRKLFLDFCDALTARDDNAKADTERDFVAFVRSLRFAAHSPEPLSATSTQDDAAVFAGNGDATSSSSTTAQDDSCAATGPTAPALRTSPVAPQRTSSMYPQQPALALDSSTGSLNGSVKRMLTSSAAVAQGRRTGPQLADWSLSLPLLVDSKTMLDVLNEKQRILVLFSADFCGFCKKMFPAYIEAAKSLPGGLCYVVDGPEAIDLRDKYEVEYYPTLLLLDISQPTPNHLVARYPMNVARTARQFVRFYREGLLGPPSHGSEQATPVVGLLTTDAAASALAPTSSSESIRNWEEVLKRSGIDLLDELKATRRRRLVQLRREIMRTNTTDDGRTEPPCIFFSGGGIAAGKSTALEYLYSTEWWSNYGSNVVMVAADDIKSQDPLFHALKAVGEDAASVAVHQSSLAAAEDLFVEAVNKRRDIIFDGTMQWAPFVLQTVAMVRDTEYVFARGPGYREEGGKVVCEKYWERKEKRAQPAKAYRIVLFGVTAAADEAVRRGIERWIVSGRAPSSTRSILKSHKLFSQNFAQYLDVFDEMLLFDRNVDRAFQEQVQLAEQQEPRQTNEETRDGTCCAEPLASSRPCLLVSDEASDTLIAWKCKDNHSSGLKILNPTQWRRFLQKAELNVNATCATELFP